MASSRVNRFRRYNIIPERRNCLKLLEMAESVGCKAINGLGMMLWQGAKAFELWTCEEMPVDYVKEQMFQKTERK